MKDKKVWLAAAAIMLAVVGLPVLCGKAVTAMAPVHSPIEMAVIMYHSVNSNPSKSGDYVITPDALRRDLEYLKNNNYNTVTMTQIIEFVHNGTELPEKPVMLTFDDGYYNNYLNAYPLLKEYNAKGVISIIGVETDKFSELDENNQNYSHLTWEQIKEMQASGLVEFQNHSYDMHSSGGGGKRLGSTRKQGESTEEYQAALENDIAKLQQRYTEMTGWTPNTFTYPFGRISKESYPVVTKLGFAASLDVQARPYIVKSGEESCLFRIPRYNRTSSTSVEQIIKKMNSNRNKGGGGGG